MGNEEAKSHELLNKLDLLAKMDALLSVPAEKIQVEVLSAIAKASSIEKNSKVFIGLGADKKILNLLTVSNTELATSVTLWNIIVYCCLRLAIS